MSEYEMLKELQEQAWDSHRKAELTVARHIAEIRDELSGLELDLTTGREEIPIGKLLAAVNRLSIALASSAVHRSTFKRIGAQLMKGEPHA